MAKASETKKVRRLRAPETMRERAAKTQQPKKRRFVMLSWPLRTLSKLGGLKIWRPIKAVGRFLGKVLVPPYIRNSFSELRKVTWPNRMQTFKLTSAVILFALIFGIIVAIVDFGLDKLFKQVILR